jgi:hypothetical protein
MITFKEISIDDLKKDHIEKRGFVIQCPTPVSDDSILSLANKLIATNITKVYPEFVVKLDNRTTLFVYTEDFDTPAFCQKAQMAAQVTGSNYETLYNFLKQ